MILHKRHRRSRSDAMAAMHDGDLISRSALLERMEQRYDEMNLRHMADIYQLGRLSGFKIAITEVENTPAVAAAPGWISVDDEQKPKHRQECFIRFVLVGRECMGVFHGIAKWNVAGDNGYVNGAHFDDEGKFGMHVTHWMPPPELPITKEG